MRCTHMLSAAHMHHIHHHQLRAAAMSRRSNGALQSFRCIVIYYNFMILCDNQKGHMCGVCVQMHQHLSVCVCVCSVCTRWHAA